MSEKSNSSRVRKSTAENSRQIDKILQERKLKAQERKLKRSAKVHENEVVSGSSEVDEIIELADNSSENSVQAEPNIEVEPPVVDPLAGLTPRSLDRSRSVSIELNRFECGNLSALSPERAGLLDLQPYPGDINENLSTIDEVFEFKMEERVYKENLKQAKLHKRKFNSLLSTFTVDDVVNIVHKEIYNGKLQNIDTKYMEISDWFDTLIIDLEENSEGERVIVIETIQNEIKALKKDHEKLVLEKMSTLVGGVSGTSTPVSSAGNTIDIGPTENRKLDELKAKANIKKSFIEDKVKSLKQKVSSFKTPTEMTNDQ